MISITLLCTQITDSLATSLPNVNGFTQQNAESTTGFFGSMGANDWVTAILAVIAIIISIYPYFKRSKVEGKIISILTTPNGDAKIRFMDYIGNIYCMKLSLYCANKNFPLKGISIRMRYNDEWKDAVDFYPRYISSKFEGGVSFQMKIPSQQYLPFNGIIPADENNHYYVCFVVPGMNKDIVFDEMELILHPYKGRKAKLCFKKEDIDSNNMLFEEEL